MNIEKLMFSLRPEIYENENEYNSFLVNLEKEFNENDINLVCIMSKGRDKIAYIYGDRKRALDIVNKNIKEYSK